MTKKTKVRLIVLLTPIASVAFLAATASLAGARQGAAQKAGQALDGAGRGIRRSVQGAFPKARMAVHEQEILSRVYSRLHWDKYLVGSTLELEVQDTGAAILRGAVADEASRRRAVVLTRDTVGVTTVVDELTVLPPARVIEEVPLATTPPTSATTVIRP